MKNSIFLTICLIMGFIIISGCAPNQFYTPTATVIPTNTPTQIPPTATSILPTYTPIPPTATSIPPTATPTPIFPVPVTLTIINESTISLTIYNAGAVRRDLWPTGPWTQYGKKNSVEAGSSIDISTQFGQVWAVSNNHAAYAQYIVPMYYINEMPNQTITVTQYGIDLAAKRNPYGTYSIPYGYPIAPVIFENNSSVALDLHYISSKREDQKLYTIPAGNSQKIDSVRFGDFFYIIDPNGNIILAYVATEPTEQTVPISDAAVAYHLGE